MNRMILKTVLVAVGAGALGAGAVFANDGVGVQVASLEVKQRIQSMEQVNVTSEVPVDDTAPAAPAAVAELLAELDAIEAAARDE